MPRFFRPSGAGGYRALDPRLTVGYGLSALRALGGDQLRLRVTEALG